MPGLSGLETAQRIRALSADVKLLIFPTRDPGVSGSGGGDRRVHAHALQFPNLVPELPRVLAESADEPHLALGSYRRVSPSRRTSLS